ncbi:carbon-nitrogen hydrolase family protein [Pseudoroseomonas globiformis]|uniref:Carbon-nitrogen hydrolase family protein n=1 Tax=Teichococcus globiformis TaxID=2307229 RepID=A0ABV7G4R1_9PROT
MNSPVLTPLKVALLQYPVERPPGIAEFSAKLDRWLAEAVRHGSHLAVLPEYACAELGAALAGQPADEAAELVALVDAAPAILNAMRHAAQRSGLWLLAGTLPFRMDDGRILNRAPLITPEGAVAFQDKHFMTRFEAERWGVSGGSAPGVFDTPWGRIGVSVCYDSEFPTHVRSQVEAGAWLILAPSCTDTLHGFNRVRLSCAARALENQCFVAMTPTVGEAPWSAALDRNRGYAAIFGPVDRGFPEDGLIARGALDAAQWVFAELDPERVVTLRQNPSVFNHRDWPDAAFPAARPAAFS